MFQNIERRRGHNAHLQTHPHPAAETWGGVWQVKKRSRNGMANSFIDFARALRLTNATCHCVTKQQRHTLSALLYSGPPPRRPPLPPRPLPPVLGLALYPTPSWPPCKEHRGVLFNVSLCVSRACLGKVSILGLQRLTRRRVRFVPISHEQQQQQQQACTATQQSNTNRVQSDSISYLVPP